MAYLLGKRTANEGQYFREPGEPFPTLMELVQRFLYKNLDAIANIGDLKDEFILPVLQRCSPSQLAYIESENMPRLLPTDDLWKTHSKRDFRHKLPEDADHVLSGKWARFYRKCEKDKKATVEGIKQRVGQAHQQAEQDRKKRKVALLTNPPPPSRGQARSYGAAAAQPPSMLKRLKQDVKKNPPMSMGVSWNRSSSSNVGMVKPPPKPGQSKGMQMLKKSMKR